MNLTAMKSRSSWLFSFADMVTLLITFFIMMIVLNKGEITRLQKWSERQLDQTYLALQAQMQQQGLDQTFALSRTPKGLSLSMRQPNAFIQGGFEPTEKMAQHIGQLARLLVELAVFDLSQQPLPGPIARYVKKEGYRWQAALRIEGHTDNDRIDPRSRLRNNWFLSTMRAQAVRQIMADAAKIEPWLVIAGFGAQRPIASNQTPAGRAKNRRITLTLSASFERRPPTNAPS